MILLYNILRNLFTVFHSGCTILPPHQQWRSLSSPPRSHQHLLCLVFLMLAMLTFVRLNFILVLICIFLMISDIEHLSCVCWPSVCFLWKCVYQGPLFIFKSGFVFFFSFLKCRSPESYFMHFPTYLFNPSSEFGETERITCFLVSKSQAIKNSKTHVWLSWKQMMISIILSGTKVKSLTK